MKNELELELLDNLGKGRVNWAKITSSKNSNNNKYAYYQKSSPFHSQSYTKPTLSDMLHTASGKTQAIFKISSYGKGEKRILAHMRYISRAGKLELEDQDGNPIKTTSDQKQHLKSWAVDFGDNIRSRDTMHLVLSTPPGTDRKHALQAAKEFLQKEYKAAGHDYVFVAHNDTDHPHVHAVVKMVSHIGKKLNPRKCYLREVRKEYAEICRSYGINVEASSRCERGLSGPSERSELVHMRRTHRKPHVDIALLRKVRKERLAFKFPIHASEEKMKIRNQLIRKRYADAAIALHAKVKVFEPSIDKAKYLNEAKQLSEFAKTMPVEISRSEQLHRVLDAKLGIPKNRQHLAEVNHQQQKTIIKSTALDKGAEQELELD